VSPEDGLPSSPHPDKVVATAARIHNAAKVFTATPMDAFSHRGPSPHPTLIMILVAREAVNGGVGFYA
jgi:hypothetical protein